MMDKYEKNKLGTKGAGQRDSCLPLSRERKTNPVSIDAIFPFFPVPYDVFLLSKRAPKNRLFKRACRHEE